MKQPGMVVVATKSSKMEAEIIVSLLESEGMPCVIDADDMGGTNPEFDFTSFVRVLVLEADEPRAREVMKAALEAGKLLVDTADVVVEPEPPGPEA